MKSFLKLFYYFIGSLAISKYLVKSFQGDAIIVMYHRVLPDEEFEKDQGPNEPLAVSLSRFEEQIRYFSKYYTPMSFDHFLKTTNKVNASKKALIVTFDDGYKDNLVYALPVLKRYQVPATIYVATKFACGDHSMWWYEVWSMCQENQKILFRWEEQFFNLSLKTMEEKMSAFFEIRSLLLGNSLGGQKRIMELIRKDLGCTLRTYPDAVLTWDEIKLLDQESLITIGSHTNNHPCLATLSREDAKKEMLIGKQLLEEKLKHEITNFAYPFGGNNHAGLREYELAKECGFKTAVTTLTKPLKSNKTTEFPRYGISNQDTTERINIRLSGWNNLWKNILVKRCLRVFFQHPLNER
jgi:peptidoglycan/xylan/chitin deacetylase (PgdA/CDA1 family)